MTERFSALRSPASSVLILNWPRAPNRAKPPPLAFLGMISVSLASLLLTSESGAPVSKISVYGPLPLILTLTIMCCVLTVSKGTVNDFGASPARAQAAAAKRSSVAAYIRSFMRNILRIILGTRGIRCAHPAAWRSGLQAVAGGDLERLFLG